MFIGRDTETHKIKDILMKNFASIIIVYGRRRVGKTALIEHVLDKNKTIKIEGKQGQSKNDQIKHALYTLAKQFKDPDISKLNYSTWTEVFDWIANKVQNEKWVLYLEELQWLSCYEDILISDLKEVWDNSLSKNSQFRLILCGSAPSFMMTKVIKSKALYNRSQFTISLGEFSPKEVSLYFKNKKSNMEIMDAILAVGGIPEYLKYLEEESSIYLSLCKNSFTKDGFFANEFEKIFTSSLADSKHYKEVIEYLAQVKAATKQEIVKHLGVLPGGSLSAVFQDLVQCGFIEEIIPYSSQAKGRIVRYAISDPYLQFYFKFIKPKLKTISNSKAQNYQKLLPLSEYRQWLGYSFERWCRKHHALIAEKLGFGAVEYDSGAYFRRADLGSSYQIDLIFKRKDRVITVCEIKYNQDKLTTSIVSEYNDKLKRMEIPRGYAIHRVLILANDFQDSLKVHFDRILTLNEMLS